MPDVEKDLPISEEVPVEYYDEATGEILDRLGRRLNQAGQELPDPRPLRPPIGFVNQPPLHELIRQMVKNELVARQVDEQAGSFEDEDDFDVEDDDYDPSSPWEENFDNLHPITGEPIKDPGGGAEPHGSKEEAQPPTETNPTD